MGYLTRAAHSFKASVLQGHWSQGAALLNPASESKSARSSSDQARVVLWYIRVWPPAVSVMDSVTPMPSGRQAM